jgi:hypothetical protein
MMIKLLSAQVRQMFKHVWQPGMFKHAAPGKSRLCRASKAFVANPMLQSGWTTVSKRRQKTRANEPQSIFCHSANPCSSPRSWKSKMRRLTKMQQAYAAGQSPHEAGPDTGAKSL